ncbi:MAG: helix-turn-helix domain-containing protein [Candidatus Micrarchaeota archaeon]
MIQPDAAYGPRGLTAVGLVKSLFPCEEVVKKYLPAMRAVIAKKLYKNGLTQQEIAKALGLTQAAVSKYLSNQYGRDVRIVEKRPDLKKACEEIARKIEREKWSHGHVASAICSACTQFNDEFSTCNLLQAKA